MLSKERKVMRSSITIVLLFFAITLLEQIQPTAPLETQALVLAAGKATRFKTQKTKILHKLCGKEMVLHPLSALADLAIPMTIVLGYQAEAVQETIIKAAVPHTTFVIQQEQLGTGHAVACTQETWTEKNILILYGDMPLISKSLLVDLIQQHKNTNASLTFCTALLDNPTGYGRIVEHNGTFEIVEEKNCTPEQRCIKLVNAGIYVINKDFLTNNIHKLEPNPLTKEIYLVDLIKMACDQKLITRPHLVPVDQIRGVNTLQELAQAEAVKNADIIRILMAQGVRFIAPESNHVDVTVSIGADSLIGRGVHLTGKTKIGSHTEINSFSILSDCQIGDNVFIDYHCILKDCTIENGSNLEPFTYRHN